MTKTHIFFIALFLCCNAGFAWADNKPFLLKASITLLGYNPEASIAAQCDARANAARITRIALLKSQPFEGHVRTYFKVAGILGTAREICGATQSFDEMPQLASPARKLSQKECEIAALFVKGEMSDTVIDQQAGEHPDVSRGYVQGVASALKPLVDACEPFVAPWMTVSAQQIILSHRAESLSKDRSCLLWRRAYYDELHKASATVKAKGRTAGLNYLHLKPIVALNGSKHFCTDPVGASTELVAYQVTKIEIESAAEK